MRAKRPSRLAIVDHLTGLYNRRYFDKRLKKIIPESKKKKKHFSLLMIDIDKFKDVNDKYGHLVGDKVLNDLAKVLKKSVRKPDICFRYGGDEVAVLLPNTERKAAENVVARLKHKVEKHRFSTEGSSKLCLKLSIGLAIFPDDGLKPRELIKQADALLYKVKARKNPKRRITEPFILETKLIPPLPKENTIARPRLLSLLKTNKNKKLILIIADAGYGKTTLLSQYLHQEKLPCVFYGLDANDRDFSVFLLHLVEAMQKIQKSLGKRTKTLFSHVENITRDVEMIMGTLINEIVKKRKEKIFIIFDDFHTIPQESSVYQALDYFIDHLPENVHIIISTRISPSLPSLARWHSKQDVFELTKEELRFTDKEIKFLLEDIYKTTLSSEELKGLALHTEGWATGLQMILQHTGAEKIKNTLNNYLESNVPLFEYFANEILEEESTVIKEFLLKSSILDWMTTDICDSVLKMNNSKETLQFLVQRNLFTTSVSSHLRIYKYHFLFKEFLQQKLAQTIASKELDELHLNAARFYMKSKDWDRAIYHLIEAKVYERAAKIIKKVGNDFITTGRTNILYHLIELLPPYMINIYPSLLVYKARILRQLGRWDESLVFFKKARKIFHHNGERNVEAEVLRHISNIYAIRGVHRKAITLNEKALGLIGTKNNRLKVKLLNSLSNSYFYMADLRAHERILKNALSLCRRHKYPDLMFMIKGNLALIYMNSDRLSQALAMYHDLFKLKFFLYNLPLATVYYCNTAWIYMIMGEFESAKQSLEKAFKICVNINYKTGQCNVFLGMGQFYQMVSEYDKALGYYDQAFDLNKDMKDKRINHSIWLGKAQCYMGKGVLGRAEECIQNCSAIYEAKRNKLRYIYSTLTLGEIKLRSGNYREAEKIFLESCRTSVRKGYGYDKLVGYIRLADLYWTKGAFSKMRIYLKKAITIAKHRQYDGILIAELNKNPKLFELTKDENIDADYFSNLMKKIGYKGYLEAYMLGEFLVKVNKKEISKRKLKTERTKSVFAYLLKKRANIISRDQLIDVFFPGFAPQKAGHNLRMCLSFIRQMFGARNFLLYENKGYRINPMVKCWTDVDEFIQRVETGEKYERNGNITEATTQYLRAVEIYKGDFLENLYDNWCEERRKYYRVIYIKTLKFLAEYFYDQTNYDQSVEYYHKIIEKDKFMEEAYCGIMRCYTKLGNQKEIIVYFNKLTKILREELGCVPLSETKKLYKQLIQ
jgi:diguanylate cyclase (GGDEF)-like protein